jgi:hypothetical protein
MLLPKIKTLEAKKTFFHLKRASRLFVESLESNISQYGFISMAHLYKTRQKLTHIKDLFGDFPSSLLQFKLYSESLA